MAFVENIEQWYFSKSHGFEKEIKVVCEYRTRLPADVVTGKLDIRDHRDAAEDAPDDDDDTADIDAVLEPAPEGDADPEDLEAPE